MAFRKAERTQAWLKVALTGPSGSGKTMSALLMAAGMGTKIAGIDTENESMQLYAGHPGVPDFDVETIDPPYTVDKYTKAIDEALRAGYDVLIIDSISHAWAGEGGLLQQKEALDARGGKGEKNKYANWSGITTQHERFRAWLLKADMHMIVTMRSKQDYVLSDGKVEKVGMAPIQRDGMEYEFTTVLDLAANHTAKSSKDRTGLFDQKLFVPTPETGEELMRWLKSGKPLEPRVTKVHAEQLNAVRFDANWASSDVTVHLREMFGRERLSELTVPEFQRLTAFVMANPKPRATTADAAAKELDPDAQAFLAKETAAPAPAAP